jgi:iron complex transport system ATP-binding protein
VAAPEATVTPLLVATELAANYGARPVLGGVSLTVREGETVALIGPNGAGKTTLLKTLAALILPRSGSVDRRTGLTVAYLAQSEELPLDWSVQDVVELGRLPHVGLWRALSAVDRAAVRSAMLRTETLALADRPLGALSGGERQRVMLARALAQEPALLLLDEPTTHLDPRHQAELFGALRAEAARGVSSLAVMHDLTLAGHADRCVLLRNGTIIADGAPETVLRADLLSEVYETQMEVVQGTDGRRAVMVRSSPSAFGQHI